MISVNTLKDEGPNDKPYMLATSGSATCADVPPTRVCHASELPDARKSRQ